MEVSFALSYKEGNEIRVSLSSFTEAAIPDLIGDLGDCEIVEISLIRQSGDEMNEIPGMRATRDISSPEYRNHLFSLLYSKGSRQFPELHIIDMPIVFIGDDHKTFIHLIYREDLQDKADIIKDYLNDIAEGVK